MLKAGYVEHPFMANILIGSFSEMQLFGNSPSKFFEVNPPCCPAGPLDEAAPSPKYRSANPTSTGEVTLYTTFEMVK